MKKTWMLLIAALLCLGAAGLLNRPLQARSEAFRPPNQTDLRQAPPIVAFTTVALGGFRGILADLLWLRVTSMQDAGQFFEITQLSEWITKLEPSFSEVWSFHAWNMAYNIGLMFDNPADRWRWVERALRMLREDGIRYNPGDPRLYGDVSWMYFNKIGGFLDNAAGYYQYRLAQSVEEVLPGGRWTGADAATTNRLVEAFRMDAKVMTEIGLAVGPLDWRLPESHAIYWAWAGRAICGTTPDLFLDRLFYQALVASCFRGGLYVAADSQRSIRLVRPDLFEPTLAVLDETLRRFPDDPGMMAARDSFMRLAIVHYYAHGDEVRAARFLERVRQHDPQAPAGLAAFVAADMGSGRLMASPGFVEQIESLFLEGELARRQGRLPSAARLDEVAGRSFESVVRALSREGQSVPMTLEQLRDRGRALAGAVSLTPQEGGS
jgi:hypothetical protein